MATGNPRPSSPSSASGPTSQPSKSMAVVVLPFRPILCSGLPRTRPGVSPPTRNVEMPRVPGASEVRAQTMNRPASVPDVIHSLEPSITQPLSVRVALVRMPPGSLPAPGSDSANAPAFSSPLHSRGTQCVR